MLDPTYKTLLFRERIRVLYAHAPQILLGGLTAAILLAVVLQGRSQQQLLNYWLSSAIIVNTVRYGLVIAFLRRNHTQFNPWLWGWLFALGSGVFGSLWGVGFFCFFRAEPLELILLTLVLAGMVSGSLASLSAFQPAYILYVTCSVSPYIWRLLAESTLLYQEIAGYTVLFSITNLLYGRNAQNILIAAMQLKLEKQDLAEQLEQQIIATNAARAKAEQASLEKSQLLAATSHDLRQPIQAQTLYLEVLRQDLHGRPEVKLVDQVVEAGQALNEMLDSLLDISRIEAGGMTPNLSHFALQPLLQRLNREFMPQAHAQNLRFKVFDTQAWCISDPLLIERIIRNLLTNALHYTLQGGIVLGCRQRGEQLCIQVWDSGVGIPEDQQDSIFREFYQLANPERDRRKGLGLGLSIVQRLCVLLAHPLAVHSRYGKGSVFSISLPQGVRQIKAMSEYSQQPSDLPENLSVLVLDDDPLVLDAAERFLIRLGCQSHCAAALEEALQIVLSLPKLDVLLVDYRLPNNTTGIDAAHRIHQALGCFVPTAVITGDINFKHPADNPQGFPVLHKPLDGARFRALLSSLSRMPVTQLKGDD